MSVIEVRNYPSAARDAISEAVSDYWCDFYKNSVGVKVNVPWKVTPSVAALAHKLFAPVVFEFGTEISLSSHPIPAISLILGSEILSKACPLPKAEIGSSFYKVNRGDHVHKVDGRDYARAVKASNGLDYAPIHYVTNANGSLDGIAESDPIFGPVIMNNVYDIDFDSLPKLMHDKKINVIHAVMILPPMLLYDQDMFDDDAGYGLRYEDDDRKNVTMYFKDQSFVYKHNKENWRKWCTVPVIEGEKCNVIVERARSLGCLTYIQITKTNYGVSLCNPIPTPLNDMKQVLDFGGIADLLFRRIYSYNFVTGNDVRRLLRRAKRVYVPRYMYDDTVIFMINRDDKLMDRNVAGTYLQGKMQTITISDHVINQGFRMNAEDFAVVAKSAFIEACIHRYKSTKEIGSILTMLKKETPGFGTKLLNTFTNLFALDNFDFFRLTLDQVHSLSRADMVTLFSLVCSCVQLAFVETSAKRHTINRYNWNCDIKRTFNPPSDGYCMVKCINRLILYETQLPPMRTIAEYDADLAKRGYHAVTSMVKSHIANGIGHATIETTGRYACPHHKSRKPVVPDSIPIFLDHDFTDDRQMTQTTMDELSSITTNGVYVDNIYALKLLGAETNFVYINPIVITDPMIVDILEEMSFLNFEYNPYCQDCGPKRMTMHINIADYPSDCAARCLYLFRNALKDSILVMNGFKQMLDHPSAALIDLLKYVENGQYKVYVSKHDGTVAFIKTQVTTWTGFGFTFRYKNFSQSVGTQTAGTYIPTQGWRMNHKGVWIRGNQGSATTKYANPYSCTWRNKLIRRKHVAVGEDEIFKPKLVPSAPPPPVTPTLLQEAINNLSNKTKTQTKPPAQIPKTALNIIPPQFQNDDRVVDDDDDDESDDNNGGDTKDDDWDGNDDVQPLFIKDGVLHMTHGYTTKMVGDYFTHPKNWELTQIHGVKTLDGKILDQKVDFVDGEYVAAQIQYRPQEKASTKNKVNDFKDKIFIFGQCRSICETINASEGHMQEVSAVLECATFHSEFRQYVKEVAADNVLYDSGSQNDNHNIQKTLAAMSFTPLDDSGHFHGKVYGVYNGRVYGEAFEIDKLEFTPMDLPLDQTDVPKFVNSLHTTKSMYKDIHDKASMNILSEVFSADRVRVNVALGVAGCGKTTAVINQFDKKDTIIVVPFAKLAKEYKDAGFKCMTVAKFFSQNKHDMKNKLVLDECFAMHPGVLPCIAYYYDKIYMVGDDKQMGYNDGTGNRNNVRSIQEKYDFSRCKRRSVSLAVPLDVCKWMNDSYETKFKTLNTRYKTVFFHNTAPPRPNEVSRALCITFATADATTFDYKTVASIQGLRYGTVHLIFSTRSHPLLNVAGQKLVALTRHTQQLHIHILNKALTSVMGYQEETVYGARLDFRTLHGNYDYTDASFKVKPLDDPTTGANVKKRSKKRAELDRFQTQSFDNGEVEVTVPAMYAINKAVFDKFPIDASIPAPFNLDKHADDSYRAMDDCFKMSDSVTTFAEAEEILRHISPSTSNQYEFRRGISHREFKDIESGLKLKIKERDRPLFTENLRRGFVSSARLRGRPTHQQNFSQELQTAIGRYAKKNVNMTVAEAKAGADVLWKGYNKLVDTTKLRPITDEELALACACQAKKIHDKGEPQNEGLFGLSYASTEKIKFHLKHQVKADLKQDSWLRGEIEDGIFRLKSGQGISARPKTVNHLCGCYIRAMENQIDLACRKGVHYGYGKNPGEMHKIVRECGIADETASVDISEQDTTKAPHVYEFSRRLHSTMGVPKFISDVLILGNIFWSITGKELILDVRYKFQSGRPDTLFDNTAHNMATLGSHFDIKDLVMLLATGDDGNIRARKIIRNSVDLFKIKVDRNIVGDFVGFLIGNDRMYLDVPRLVAKLMNREYFDYERVEEYQVAVRDWLSVNDSHQHVVENCHLVAVKYGIGYIDAYRLISFLYQFAYGKVIPEDMRTANLVRTYQVDKVCT